MSQRRSYFVFPQLVSSPTLGLPFSPSQHHVQMRTSATKQSMDLWPARASHTTWTNGYRWCGNNWGISSTGARAVRHGQQLFCAEARPYRETFYWEAVARMMSEYLAEHPAESPEDVLTDCLIATQCPPSSDDA